MTRISIQNGEIMTQVVVICYPNDWHWVLSIEFINSQLAGQEDIEVWDFSWIGEDSFKNRIKRILRGTPLQRNCKKWLRDNNVQIRSAEQWIFSKPTVINQFSSITENFKNLHHEHHSVIYNTLVEKIGNLVVDVDANKRIIKKELKTIGLISKNLETQDLSQISRVITVNGRFSKNAQVKNWTQLRKLKLTLLEFGSDIEKFEEFNVSPHSESEVIEKIFFYWNSADKSLRNEVAEKYLDALLDNKVSSINWRQSMHQASLPVIDPNKRICVFFASTESEAAGLGDKTPPGYFNNQVEAFTALVENLPTEKWHIFLRRHPANPNTPHAVDPERHIWEEFKERSNVSVIEPSSSVDSIVLGMTAEIAAVYWSSIAIELLMRGHRNVITMGRASWNPMIPEGSVLSEDALKTYLNGAPPKISVNDLAPWAYYYATFGKKFQVFFYSTTKLKWFVDKK